MTLLDNLVPNLSSNFILDIYIHKMNEIISWIIAISLVIIAITLVWFTFISGNIVYIGYEISEGDYTHFKPLGERLTNNIIIPRLRTAINNRINELMNINS